LGIGHFKLEISAPTGTEERTPEWARCSSGPSRNAGGSLGRTDEEPW